MKEENDFNIRDTSLHIWQDDHKSHPTLEKIFELMRTRGFIITNDYNVDKIIRKSYYVGKKGNLLFHAHKYPRGFEIEFYQEVNIKNSNGGRYDFDKFKMMPYLIKKQFILESNHIRQLLFQEGYIDNSTPIFKTSLEKIMHRLNSSDRHWKNDKLENYNATDKDGKRMESGQVKYFRDRKGTLLRGTVYHNINNMWWVIINKDDYTNEACFYFFDLETNEENKIHKLIKRSGHHNPKSRIIPSESDLLQQQTLAKKLKRQGRIEEINKILSFLYENNWLSRKFQFHVKDSKRLGLLEPEGKPFGMYRKFDEPKMISLDKEHLPMSSTESGWIRSLEKYVRKGIPSVGTWFCRDGNGEGSKAYLWADIRIKLLQIGAMNK